MRRQRATNSCACVVVIVINVSSGLTVCLGQSHIHQDKVKRQTHFSGGILTGPPQPIKSGMEEIIGPAGWAGRALCWRLWRKRAKTKSCNPATGERCWLEVEGVAGAGTTAFNRVGGHLRYFPSVGPPPLFPPRSNAGLRDTILAGLKWSGIQRRRKPPRKMTSARVTVRKTMLMTALRRKKARLIQLRLRRRAIQCSNTRQPTMSSQPMR